MHSKRVAPGHYEVHTELGVFGVRHVGHSDNGGGRFAGWAVTRPDGATEATLPTKRSALLTVQRVERDGR